MKMRLAGIALMALFCFGLHSFAPVAMRFMPVRQLHVRTFSHQLTTSPCEATLTLSCEQNFDSDLDQAVHAHPPTLLHYCPTSVAASSFKIQPSIDAPRSSFDASVQLLL